MNKSFEKALAELETIVGKMESGELTLDDSLEKYEEGIKLARFCKDKLDKAEKRIEIVVKNADGSISLEQFDDSSGQPVSSIDASSDSANETEQAAESVTVTERAESDQINETVDSITPVNSVASESPQMQEQSIDEPQQTDEPSADDSTPEPDNADEIITAVHEVDAEAEEDTDDAISSEEDDDEPENTPYEPEPPLTRKLSKPKVSSTTEDFLF